MTLEEYRTKAADIRKRAIHDPELLKEWPTLEQQYEQSADLLEKKGCACHRHDAGPSGETAVTPSAF